MYIEKKKIGNRTYNYLKISARVGGTVRTKTIAYLGTAGLTKKQLEEKISVDGMVLEEKAY